MSKAIEKILPCVCIDHEPNAGDECYYGMPILKVVLSTVSGRVYYEAACPNCGRGGIFQFASAYKALKFWNETVLSIRDTEEFIRDHESPDKKFWWEKGDELNEKLSVQRAHLKTPSKQEHKRHGTKKAIFIPKRSKYRLK